MYLFGCQHDLCIAETLQVHTSGTDVIFIWLRSPSSDGVAHDRGPEPYNCMSSVSSCPLRNPAPCLYPLLVDTYDARIHTATATAQESRAPITTPTATLRCCVDSELFPSSVVRSLDKRLWVTSVREASSRNLNSGFRRPSISVCFGQGPFEQ